MRSFASFSATAPVQKQRFLRCYYIASRKAFDPRNIRAAFRGAGIWPVDVEQCMRNKGGIIHMELLPAVPETPKKALIGKDQFFYTPRSSKEVKTQLDLVRQNLEETHRGLRIVAQKAGKELDRKNALIATLQAKIKYLEAALDSQAPKGRKTVERNPNEVFYHIEAIKKARDEAEAAAQSYQDRYRVDMEEDAAEIARNTLEGLCHEWQL